MVRVVDIIIEINFLILSPRERLKEPQIGSFQNPAKPGESAHKINVFHL